MLDVETIRAKYPFLSRTFTIKAENGAEQDRLFLDNTASTHLPEPVLEKIAGALFHYANVHRGEYNASQRTTEELERTYNIAANLVNAESWREIILGRNASEMMNLVMRGLESQVRDGDNVVVSRLEHNSNYVPWYWMQKMMERSGKELGIRVVDFDKETGKLDMDQLQGFVDDRTKIVAVTGASNFMGIKPDIHSIAGIAHASGYDQPDGSKGSYFLVDGAQLVPGCPVDVQAIDCDFLAWSFHKMSIPLGVGGLYGKKAILEQLDPFLFGGDMVADVKEGKVSFKELPWKFTAGTPNILGTIATGYGINFLVNLGLGNLYIPTPGNGDNAHLCSQIETEILMNTPRDDFYVSFTVPKDLQGIFRAYLANNPRAAAMVRDRDARLKEVNARVHRAMTSIMHHEQELTQYAIDSLLENDDIKIYGTHNATERTGLVAFNVKGMKPEVVAKELNKRDLEMRHGAHCASLAHESLGIEGSVRMSFYVYNTKSDVDAAVEALTEISKGM